MTASLDFPALVDPLDVVGALCPLPLLRLDSRGQVLQANAAFSALLAQPLHEIADAPPPLRELLGWQGADAPKAAVVNSGTLIDAQGRPRHFTARLSPLPNQDAYLAILEEHHAEQSADVARRVELDSVLVGIVIVGRGGIEWMNRSARRMFGASLSDCIGQPVDIVATRDPNHPLRQPRRLDDLPEGESESFECRIKALDGRQFWVAGNALVTQQGGQRRLTYALLDIDRRREAEAQTEAARASLARMIEAAPLAISLHDARSRRIERVNQAAADIAGIKPEALIGARPEALFGAQAGALVAADMELAMRAAVGSVVERELKSGVGAAERVWDLRLLHLSGDADAGASGDAGQVLLVASEVTAQRAAEAERLREAIAQRELLVREVHHRIKNNLQGVVGLLQGIADRRPEVATALQDAVGQVGAIAQVYGLQVGDDGPPRVREVMEAIVASVCRMTGTSIATHTVVEAGDAEAWRLREGDSIPVALALNELLTNALKHGRGEVSCSLVVQSDRVRLEIRNKGQLPAGFVPGQSTTGGSGLSLVRALLPRRGAHLRFEQTGEKVLCTLELQAPGTHLGDMQASAKSRQLAP